MLKAPLYAFLYHSDQYKFTSLPHQFAWSKNQTLWINNFYEGPFYEWLPNDNSCYIDRFISVACDNSRSLFICTQGLNRKSYIYEYITNPSLCAHPSFGLHCFSQRSYLSPFFTKRHYRKYNTLLLSRLDRVEHELASVTQLLLRVHTIFWILPSLIRYGVVLTLHTLAGQTKNRTIIRKYFHGVRDLYAELIPLSVQCRVHAFHQRHLPAGSVTSCATSLRIHSECFLIRWARARCAPNEYSTSNLLCTIRMAVFVVV